VSCSNFSAATAFKTQFPAWLGGGAGRANDFRLESIESGRRFSKAGPCAVAVSSAGDNLDD